MLQVITRESDDILMKAQTRGDVEKTHSVDDTMHLIQVSKVFTILYHSSARPENEICTLNGPFIAGNRMISYNIFITTIHNSQTDINLYLMPQQLVCETYEVCTSIYAGCHTWQIPEAASTWARPCTRPRT